MARFGRVQSVVLTSSASQMAPQNPKRAAIVFFAPNDNGADDYTVSTDSGVVTGGGLNLVKGMAPVVLRREDFGDAIGRAWYGILVTGGPKKAAYMESTDGE